MSSTVLVTGGNGYVAGWCIVELLRQGHAVRTTVRSLKREDALRRTIAGAGADPSALTVFAADLMSDDGWDAAMAGCDHVLHVASPLGGGEATRDHEALVAPARDGTLRVLRAAARAGVRRVVMTSAAAAARPPLDSGRISDETTWADPADPQFDAYRVSKIRAERAAWDFISAQRGPTELTTILPGAVFGPVLSRDNLGSVKIIADLVAGRPPLLPRLGFWVTDVRDLAAAHIRAMTEPPAAGQRFIIAGEFLWFEDIARILRDRLGARGGKVPQRRLPTPLVRLLVPFMPALRTLAPLIGRRFELTAAKAHAILGYAPRPAAETLADCARSLPDLAG